MNKIDVSKITASFRSLDPRQIYNWPWPPKSLVLAGFFCSALALGYYFLVSDTYDSLEREVANEVKLKEEFIGLKKQSVNLALYKKQLIDIEKLFGDLLKQLPNKSEVDSLLVDINQAGIGRGLSFELFRPGAEKKSDFYAELPVGVKLVGTYADIAAFASDVAGLSRIVVLSDLNMVTTGAGNQPITMEAVARTFRYLDEAEVAEKKKADTEKTRQAKAAAAPAKPAAK